MNSAKFIMRKANEIYENDSNFDKKMNEELISKYHELTKQEQEILFLNNMRLVIKIANQKACGNEDLMEEFTMIGSIGLKKALDNFNPDFNVNFSSYAYKCVQNEIGMQLRKNLRTSKFEEISLDQFVDDDDIKICKIDTIGNESNYINDMDHSEKITYLFECIKELSLDDQYILFQSYGLNNYETLSQIQMGEHLNCSRNCVARKKQRALQKLQKKYVKKYPHQH